MTNGKREFQKDYDHQKRLPFSVSGVGERKGFSSSNTVFQAFLMADQEEKEQMGYSKNFKEALFREF